jgi:hypothetical protein
VRGRTGDRIVERALEKGRDLRRHEIVHNRHVVERLRAKGGCREIDEVPPGSVTIFSAHGVASGSSAGPEAGLPSSTPPARWSQGAHRRKPRQPGARDHPHWARRPPRIQGTMGRITGGPPDLAAGGGRRLGVAARQARLHHRDHLSVDDRAVIEGEGWFP